jgi:hypothetical protein
MGKRYELTANYVPALTGEIVSADHESITSAEAQLMTSGHHLANVALSGRSAQSRAEQSDTALTHAKAHLVASAPLIASLVATTTGLVLLGWLIAGGSASIWISVELLIAGAGSVIALARSRRGGLDHTPAGVERHEIDARSKVAMHAIDRHCEMVERMKGVRK